MLALLDCPLLFSLEYSLIFYYVFIFCLFVSLHILCVVVSFVCPFLRGRRCSVAVSIHHYYVIYCALRMCSSMILAA